MDSSSRDTLHGVFLSVTGIGILITGGSGIGKSDCALELVSRGHKLIADDVVEVERVDNSIFGSAPKRFAGLLAVRGVGIIDVRQVFGNDSFGARRKIRLCIEFRADVSERLGDRTDVTEILGVKIPGIVLPVDRRRNLPLLVETAVKLNRINGVSAEDRLIAAHDQLVSASAA